MAKGVGSGRYRPNPEKGAWSLVDSAGRFLAQAHYRYVMQYFQTMTQYKDTKTYIIPSVSVR